MIVYKIDYVQKGKLKSVKIKAKTLHEALRIFRKKYQGSIKDISEVNEESFLEKLAKIFETQKIDNEEFIAVLDQLYVMLDAGISIDTALSQVLEGIKNKNLKRMLEDIYTKINSGYSLVDAFKVYEKAFGIITIAMIKLGEESGDIASAIKDLSNILSEIEENRKRFKKATRYPMFVIFAMVIAFTIVILFVIPPFKSMFAQLHTELPLPTRFLLWIEWAIRKYAVLIISSSIVIFGVLNYLYHKNEKFHLLVDRMMLKIYILGKVIHLAMIGRFVYVLQSLINSGIPIVTSVEIALSIVENSYLHKKLSLIKDEIVKGGSITDGFRYTGLFEPMVIQMIRAGEESGSLTKMFKKIADYYLGEYRYVVDNISTLIEPILIAAIAGFVFTLALGIFLPMWNLTEAIK